MHVATRHLQGVFPFVGAGLSQPSPLPEDLAYTVPRGKEAQLIYFRAGSSADALIFLVVTRNGVPMRYFPIGARASVHIALALVEDIPAGTVLSVLIGAPEGLEGTVVIDVGLAEIG